MYRKKKQKEKIIRNEKVKVKQNLIQFSIRNTFNFIQFFAFFCFLLISGKKVKKKQYETYKFYLAKKKKLKKKEQQTIYF